MDLKRKEGIAMNVDRSILGTLTDRQKEKIEAAQSPEELLALAERLENR